MFALGGGDAVLALGLSIVKEKFDKTPSNLAQGFDDNGNPDSRFGDTAAIIPYNAQRKVTGLFAEALLPVGKSFEITPSLRHDGKAYGNVAASTPNARCCESGCRRAISSSKRRSQCARSLSRGASGRIRQLPQ